jgi:UPF0716 protein FxsA
LPPAGHRYDQRVGILLALLFIVVPLLELWLIIEVGQRIGALETVGALLVVSIVGAWLVKHQGLGVIGRIRRRTAAGQVPGVELVDGAMILVGGALLLTPGFLTDGVGLALLVPPVRATARRVARRVLARRVAVVGPAGRLRPPR